MGNRSKSSRDNRLGFEQLENRVLLAADAFSGGKAESFRGLHKDYREIPLYAGDASPGDFAGRGVLGDEIFELQSKPDSNFTIYLDFDGHVTQGTVWNSNYNINTITTPPFDLDNNPNEFSQTELNLILTAWQDAAEDFAPFDVNVTTKFPGLDALIRSNNSDTTWGARAVITDDVFANCGCGGHAFLNSFNSNVDTPTFVYTSSVMTARAPQVVSLLLDRISASSPGNF
ncbi:MAG: LEPR-XLL domain-containing protein, partial [Planctomycetota bacterium]